MQKSELLARLMACDPARLKGRRRGALADEILKRAAGDDAEIARELIRLGHCATRNIQHGATVSRR